MHEDWIEALREAVTRDGGELPEGLWERIAASLDAVPPATGVFPPHSMRRRRFRVRAASVAAAAVILAAGIFMVLTLRKNADDMVIAQPEIAAGNGVSAGNAIAGIADPELPATKLSDPELSSAEPEQPGRNGGYIEVITEPNASRPEPVAGNEDISEPVTEPVTEAVTEAAEDGEPEPVYAVTAEPDNSTEKEDVSSAEFSKDARSLPRSRHSGTAAIAKSSVRSGMLALSASGLSISSGGSPQNPNMMMKTATLTPNREGYMVMEVRPAKYSYRHRQPLMFAVSVDFGVGHNLFAGTGVSYTRLSSIATDTASGDEFDQLLQYVGVPATFKWTFLNTKLFMLYTGAEAQAEFCVGARFGGLKADERTMQLSLHALAGAQLNLGRHVGIYAEPKLSHYFLDTALETVRNTDGVNFNLQLGMRFSY